MRETHPTPGGHIQTEEDSFKIFLTFILRLYLYMGGCQRIICGRRVLLPTSLPRMKLRSSGLVASLFT